MRPTAALLGIALLAVAPGLARAADAPTEFGRLHDLLQETLKAEPADRPIFVRQVAARINDAITSQATLPTGLSSRWRATLESMRDKIAANPLFADLSLRQWNDMAQQERPPELHVGAMVFYVLHRAAQRSALALRGAAVQAGVARDKYAALTRLVRAMRSDGPGPRLEELGRKQVEAVRERRSADERLARLIQVQSGTMQALSSLARRMGDSAGGVVKTAQ